MMILLALQDWVYKATDESGRSIRTRCGHYELCAGLLENHSSTAAAGSSKLADMEQADRLLENLFRMSDQGTIVPAPIVDCRGAVVLNSVGQVHQAGTGLKLPTWQSSTQQSSKPPRNLSNSAQQDSQQKQSSSLKLPLLLPPATVSKSAEATAHAVSVPNQQPNSMMSLLVLMRPSASITTAATWPANARLAAATAAGSSHVSLPSAVAACSPDSSCRTRPVTAPRARGNTAATSAAAAAAATDIWSAAATDVWAAAASSPQPANLLTLASEVPASNQPATARPARYSPYSIEDPVTRSSSMPEVCRAAAVPQPGICRSTSAGLAAAAAASGGDVPVWDPVLRPPPDSGRRRLQDLQDEVSGLSRTNSRLQHEAASLLEEKAKLSASLHALRSKLLAVQKQNACLAISNQHTQGAIGALQGLLAARQQVQQAQQAQPAQQLGGQVLQFVSTAQQLLDQQASQLQQFQQLQVQQGGFATKVAQHTRTDPAGLAKAASAGAGAGAAGFPKLPEGGFLQMLTTDDTPDTRQPTEAELSDVLNWLDEPL